MTKQKMNRRLTIIFCIVLCCITVTQGCVIIYGRAYYIKKEAHGDKQDCSICHKSHQMKVTGLLRKPISDLCLECHPTRKAPSEHVVDVVPSMEIKGLPLTDGKMTCVTCHDSHQNIYKGMLRVKPQDLCQSCHKL